MPTVRSTIHVQPGDTFVAPTFTPGETLQSVTLCAKPEAWYMGPLNLHADIPTLLALADSLVGAAYQLRTAALAAAAPFTPADPEVTAEG